MKQNWGFLDSSWKTNLEKKIKRTQIQPGFVLKLLIDLKLGMICT